MFNFGKDGGNKQAAGKKTVKSDFGGGLFGMPAPGAGNTGFQIQQSVCFPSSSAAPSSPGSNLFLPSSNPASSNVFATRQTSTATSGIFKNTSPTSNPFSSSSPSTTTLSTAPNPFANPQTKSSGFSAPSSNLFGVSGGSSAANISTAAPSSLFQSGSSANTATAPSNPFSETGTTTTTTAKENIFGSNLFSSKSTPKLDTAKASSFGSSIFGEAKSDKLFHTPEVKLFGAKDLNSGAGLFGKKTDPNVPSKQLFGISSSKEEQKSESVPAPLYSSGFGGKTTTEPIFGAKTTTGAIFGAKSENAEISSSKLLFRAGKTETPAVGSSLFGESKGSSASTLFGGVPAGKEGALTFQVKQPSASALFGNQPDIVKPSLSSRLCPPQPISQSAVEKEGDDEEEGEWDGEEEELGEEEEEVDGGEEEEDGGEGDDYGEEESKIETSNEPPALEVEPPKKRMIQRTCSKEEVQTMKFIICEKVPSILNNVITLTKHFSKFGNVIKVQSYPGTQSAIVQFTDHKEAKAARTKGKIVHSEVPAIEQIYYYSPGGKRRIRHSTGGSSCSEDTDKPPMAAANPAGEPARKAVDLFGAKQLLQKETKQIKKPFSLSKVLKPQGRSENLEDKGTIDPGIVRSTESLSQLLAIMKTQTFSHSDRLSVLEARDKYIRLRNPDSVTRAGTNYENVNLKGTCPDMCSERERYSRSAKNQLRWFEKETGELNHFATVKEHSRSAADQDVPLSHELRPAPVLNKTLNFLMCNIMDRIDYMSGSMLEWFSFVESSAQNGDVYNEPMANFVPQSDRKQFSVGDWFEYIWSTTRAIRKDITQQNLVDTVSVSLVEKCARFHIFCSERLIEEDAHDFDPKLNNENMTKCMQTLKHMYYDLSLEGIFCENEAEFRSYDILLNLNEGDTLRKAQSLSAEVRNHPSVVHALKICNTINSNNYVRFFRLVRQSSYLEMCILKRYFYQVRRRAIDVMVRAFVAPRQVVQFPIEKIFDMLAFESLRECASFLRQHGIESEDDTAYLDRGGFRHPDTAPKQARSYNLIDSRKTTSYGEVVNGGPLPPNPYLTYEPHNSFDKNGFLKPESYEAKDQEGGQSPEELEQQRLEDERRKKLMEESKLILAGLITSTVETEAKKIAIEAIAEAKLAVHIKAVYQSIIMESVEENLTDIATKSIKEAKNALLMERLAEQKVEEEKEVAIETIIEEMVDKNIETVAQESLTDARLNAKADAEKSAASRVVDQLCQEVADDLTATVAAQAMQEEQDLLEQKIKKFQQASDRRLLAKYLKVWHQLVSKRRKRNMVLDDFPVMPASYSPEQQSKRLKGGETGKRKSLSQQKLDRMELDNMLKMAVTMKSVQESAVLLPFDLVSWLGERGDSMPMYKMLISSENLDDSADFYPIQQMIFAKFKRMFPSANEDENKEIIIRRRVLLGDHALLSLCVRNVTQEALDSALFSEINRRQLFSGSSGILFLHLDPEVNPCERLEAMLVNRPSIPSIPIQVITCMEQSAFEEMTNIGQYVEKALISGYQIRQVSDKLFNIDNCVSVTEAVRSLVQERPLGDPTKALITKPLTEFAESFLPYQIFGEMYRNRLERYKKGLPDRSFTDLVTFYNAGLDHLATTLKETELGEICWPIPEFSATARSHAGTCDLPANWNDTLYIDSCVQLLDLLRMEELHVYETDSWQDLIDQVWVYVKNVVTGCKTDTSMLYSAIQRALQKSYRKFADKCSQLGGDTHPIPPLELLPWTDILISCAEYRLQELVQQEDVTKRIVGYKEATLYRFQLPKEWLCGQSYMEELKEKTIMQHVNDSVTTFRESLCVEETYLNADLHQLLTDEQKDSLRYEKKLENALKENYTPDSSSFMLDIEELEKEEELLKKSGNINEDDIIEDTCENVNYAFQSVLHQLSPRLGLLIDSPFVNPRLRRQSSRQSRQVDHMDLDASWQQPPPVDRQRWTSGGRKRRQDRHSSGDKRFKRSFDYSEELSPQVSRELTGRLDTLKHSIHHEITQSLRLEAKLKEALEK